MHDLVAWLNEVEGVKSSSKIVGGLLETGKVYGSIQGSKECMTESRSSSCSRKEVS